MDKASSAKAHNAPAGVSIRNGPILDDKMDVDEPATNGTAKRKARTSTSKPVKYNDEESEEDLKPSVCKLPARCDRV
jgi:DNA topoisomerase-1